MSYLRPSPFARRGWVAVAAAVVFVAACDTTASFRPGEQNWGFINVGALSTGSGEYRTAPTAVFFRGAISSVPNAAIRSDSCFLVGDYVAPSNSFTGVTYLDAGTSIATTIGGVLTDLPRVSNSTANNYGLATGTTVAYRPGDSVVIKVPGVAGGYPAAEIRGKSAEAFTIQPITPVLNAVIPLRWTKSTDASSALIVSLQYTPAGSTSRTQEIRCAFNDDGVDSIPARQHLAWSADANVNRRAVVTRLRTALFAVDGGAIQLISTFQVPTPLP